jgi:GGDEF domain-containing protein
MINDTWASDDFRDNPLVVGQPGIRAYLGWPLEVAPGLKAGALCVVDTMPRNFSPHEIQTLKELAVLAEAELKKDFSSGFQGRVALKLGVAQREAYLDPLTGCWNLTGLRKAVASALVESRTRGHDLAVCCWQVEYSDQIARGARFHNHEALIQPLAQALRRRLPESCVLARFGRSSFCAVIAPAPGAHMKLELARLNFRSLAIDSPDSPSQMHIPLRTKVTMLFENGQQALADEFWQQVLRSGAA